MKPKTTNETSGTSPTKVSESDATILTGRGVEQVRARIAEAFRLIHNDQPAPVKPEKQPKVYGEEHKQRFHQRVQSLTRSALTLGMLTISHSKARANVWEIEVPQESVEELIREALGELGEDE